MRRYLLCSAWVSVFAAALYLSPIAVQAETNRGFAIDTGSEVVSCSAQWNGDRKALAESLKAGIEVIFHWHINVARVRRYWLNEDVADIEFSRRVRPDLLARRWILEDSASGISRRVFTLAEAIDFLTSIKDFPVLDKAVLSKGEIYELTITIEKQEGVMSTTWWARLWKNASLQMRQDFSLP